MIHCRYQADRISQDALLHLHLLPIPLNAKTSSSTQPLLLLSSWLFVSIVLLIVPGLVLHWCDVFPLNKNIWSVSYFLFTTGVSGTVLAVLYGVIDGPWRIRAVGVIMQVMMMTSRKQPILFPSPLILHRACLAGLT